MEPVNNNLEGESKETKTDITNTSESLKVYIRIRPRLKNEYLKETAAFDDPNVSFI